MTSKYTTTLEKDNFICNHQENVVPINKVIVDWQIEIDFKQNGLEWIIAIDYIELFSDDSSFYVKSPTIELITLGRFSPREIVMDNIEIFLDENRVLMAL